ncbi:30S ribosomal protein S6 [Candidatus Microgenomates bacterium]|jgi:small subunit ribosomal protein S6|nr:MAG: 30S ribosomal protein S6 [Candidatus Microgenomates bacterium]
MSNYEMVVILDPEIKGEEQEKLLSKIKKFITDAEGKVAKEKDWGKKELAYPIKKRNAGIFHILNFSAPSPSLSSLRQRIELEDKVLRYLMIASE